MSNILLIDIDSKIPNLALMKISQYHKSLGDNVDLIQCHLNRRKYNRTEIVYDYDKTYISFLYDKNEKFVKSIGQQFINEVSIGGGGRWIGEKLPKNIECLKPDYDLYDSEYSQGFTTRGCFRDCDFCLVDKKEGKFKTWQDISFFHDERFKNVMVMDNNFLGNKKNFFKQTDFLLENNLGLMDNGMDCRLVDEKIVERLVELKKPDGYKFAFDSLDVEENVKKTINLFNEYGMTNRRNLTFYVLVGFNTSIEEDLYRIDVLEKTGGTPYIMRYHRENTMLNKLARYVNNKLIYNKCDSFQEYVESWKV